MSLRKVEVPREVCTIFYIQLHNNTMYLTKEIVPNDAYLGMLRTDACGDVVRMCNGY